MADMFTRIYVFYNMPFICYVYNMNEFVFGYILALHVLVRFNIKVHFLKEKIIVKMMWIALRTTRVLWIDNFNDSFLKKSLWMPASVSNCRNKNYYIVFKWLKWTLVQNPWEKNQVLLVAKFVWNNLVQGGF